MTQACSNIGYEFVLLAIIVGTVVGCAGALTALGLGRALAIRARSALGARGPGGRTVERRPAQRVQP